MEFINSEGGRPAFRRKLVNLYKEKGLSIIVLEPGCFDGGVKRYAKKKDGYAVVYDYDKLAVALAKDYLKTAKKEGRHYTEEDAYTDAVEWIDFNTIRSIPYMSNGNGIPPIVVVTDENGEEKLA